MISLNQAWAIGFTNGIIIDLVTFKKSPKMFSNTLIVALTISKSSYVFCRKRPTSSANSWYRRDF